MSTVLYELGAWCYRHRRRVLGLWLVALLLLGGGGVLAGGTYDDNFTIPGAPSQVALEKLQLTFPEASDQTAQAIVIAPEGRRVDDPAVKAGTEKAVQGFETVPHVAGVVSPFSTMVSGLVSSDRRVAIIQIRLDTAKFSDITDAWRAALVAEGTKAQAAMPAGTAVHLGGQAFSIEVPSLSATEGAGLLVALAVLVLTFGSLLAAGLPLLTGVFGVGLSMGVMLLCARLTTISSTSPILSVMLGLAVGIDYALFILSRHRDQLRDGLDPAESAARAVATAGSAVVFAGLTVVIALVGLTLANIPFLAVMGIFAAITVALTVCVALTLLPAMMGFFGERMRPRRKASAPAHAVGAAQRVFGLWVRAAIKWPVVTIVVIVLALGALALPATHLRLALPNSGDHAAGQADRVTYDLVEKHFGPGFNAPLILTADILGSTDPLGVMAGLKKDIQALPGVAETPLATPNRNADTGFVQIVPTTGPGDPATRDLVLAIRAHHDQWLKDYGVETAVTGQTAIQIDVSDRLATALIPFGIFVAGLSLVLLTMVFRSIWVPVKATIGYLLSVGAAFGATALVFNDGWGRQVVNLERPGPVISFLPIVTMGILFGLAMDYEVFLVSRIREDYVHLLRAGRDRHTAAREAIVTGFVASGKVVLAAAVIMFSVFAFFVPHGMGPIKSIAFSLAVGVFVDAVLIRMTLVPAVLALLGPRAWWLPGWLDRRLPSLDIEGESLTHQLGLAAWPTPDHTEALHASRLTAGDLFAPVSLHAEPGEVVVLAGDADQRSAAMLALAGRLAVDGGQARVAGELLPEQAYKVRRETGFVRAKHHPEVAHELAGVLRRRPVVVFVDDADTLTDHESRAALGDLIASARETKNCAVVLGATRPAALDRLQPDRVVVVDEPPVLEGAL